MSIESSTEFEIVNRRVAKVHAPGSPTFELHTLGWRSFQDLCAAILYELWGQTVQPFADTHDAGRDGAFYGTWDEDSGSSPLEGPFVIQCKFFSAPNHSLSLSSIKPELSKIRSLVEKDLCRSYVLLSNGSLSGDSEDKIVNAIKDSGVINARVFGAHWLNIVISSSKQLRMYVPRVYGLGDLSHIIDERAYDQANALIEYLKDDLATFVPTKAYERAAEAISEHGFCLLLGNPGVGKTVIAATLAVTATDQWQCHTIKADRPSDIVSHWNPHEPNQFFWLDDVFGPVRHDQSRTDEWTLVAPKVRAAIRRGAKVIMTSREYIYRTAKDSLKEYEFPQLKEQKVVIDVAELSQHAREQIVYNHIRLGDQPKEVRAALKPHLESFSQQEPFSPEVAKRLGKKEFTRGLKITALNVAAFMAKPNEYLQDVLNNFEPDLIGALALVYQSNYLAVPFEVTTKERQELLAKVGSNPTRVDAALDALEGTFLRCAQKPGVEDNCLYWSFRHPSIREGFAKFIENKPNLLELFIEGLDISDVMTQLDCGSGAEDGTLVAVPSQLFPLIIERVAEARVEAALGSLVGRYTWTGFLSSRCSADFLRLYLDADPDVLKDCLSFNSSLSVVPELSVLAKFFSMGLLSEASRVKVVERVSDLAIETPDAGWVNNNALMNLMTDREHENILERAREELVPNLDDVFSVWYDNEEGELDDHYYPLVDTLETYQRAFDLRDDVEAINLLEEAIDRIHDRCSESHGFDEDDDYEYSRYQHLGQGDKEMDARSIFDDVDA
jgi:hypothetical protein